MVTHPNAKINLGLNVLRRREDGYHDIETVFIPLLPQYGYKGEYYDTLEIGIRNDDKVSLKIFGAEQTWDTEDDLCVKAYREMCRHFELPGIDIRLTKRIPSGAGLGGGSSDAAFTMRMINDMLGLGADEETLAGYAANFGSDTSFFIYNRPMLATGRGEILMEIPNPLPEGCNIGVVMPDIHISTKEAYGGVTPAIPDIQICDILNDSFTTWKDRLCNDFEKHLFEKYPVLNAVKNSLYDAGAFYASMSGSGSALYGLFTDR